VTLAPALPRARSFLARKLAAIPPAGSRDSLAQFGMVDLSPLPRTGFKGRGTIPAMQAAGLQVEAKPNQAFRQSDGSLCAVLAPGEVMVLSGLSGSDALVRRLESGWSMDDPRDTYVVPRSSTHAWFRIIGRDAPAMFAKICGVDLRPHKFAELAIAQTSVVKLTGIIIREDVSGTPGFHLLADSASAEYVWDCVLDAMDEFGGRPAGLPALRELAGSNEAADIQPG
jgi:sarcosine oxidase subunit gamma